MIDSVILEPAVQPPEETPDLSSALASLYVDFRRSIHTLDELPTHDSSAAEGAEEAQTQVLMSKAQAALAREEGQFWQALISDDTSAVENISAGDTDAGVTPIDRLSKIFAKSTFMAESYLRRSNPPTTETYAESRAILEAMGIPVIVTAGPYEAEALASSIVLCGMADYVASEDTVRARPLHSILCFS
jgi:flap endonuclease-1